MRNLQILLVDPDADFQSRFKREVEAAGGVEVATCSLGRKAAVLAGFIHFDAVFANAAAGVPYEEVREKILRNIADADFFVYGEGEAPPGFARLAPEEVVERAKALVRSLV
ncbi:MAG: hypothetical protein D6739_04430 [Nitrospirae bacterium]|nr:MAG: hypothetical protein D6739_04430 [Nitrospirota bacterium]